MMDEFRERFMKQCTPWLGAERYNDLFNRYGLTISGICDGWRWFTNETITAYAREQGHKPIEEASKEEIWEMLATSALYWNEHYKQWLVRSEEKSTKLDRFIGECEYLYFGYDKNGYTLKTVDRVLAQVLEVLENNKED